MMLDCFCNPEKKMIAGLSMNFKAWMKKMNRVNSKYYEVNQFNDIPSSFGLFHVNSSLNKHIEDLTTILSLLNFNFDIIGISEHKNQKR